MQNGRSLGSSFRGLGPPSEATNSSERLSGGQHQLLSTSRAYLADVTINVPQMAESISEGTLATFHKKVGDYVEADEEIASIETDKIDVPVNSPEEGVIAELLVEEGDVVVVGQPLVKLEAGAGGGAQQKKTEESKSEKPKPTESSTSGTSASQTIAASPEPQQQAPPPTPSPTPDPTPLPTPPSTPSPSPTIPQEIQNQSSNPSYPSTVSRNERVEKMTRMRKTIATRLKESQNRCASLTTVQEVDMTNLIAWRAKYKEEVAKEHGVRLGYMGAFSMATTMAAKLIPQINASIDTDKETITYRDYVDISIAVSSPKGLVTPVVRNCESKSIIELERDIAHLATKAREGKLTMDDLQGGNFSISNPGIFNSMFGTPVINYPQAAVFNMNTIKDRVVAINGKAEIRPIMYITITYDHRLIDGREAVSFLNTVKRYVEDPSRMLLG
ncbi:dihydrolipoamide succinyltransferase [Sarocladium strictum]